MQRALSLRFDKHAFLFLNIAQFFAVLNDNLFKFLTIYLLIDLQGKEASNDILFWVGVCFVLPFLLFSSAGGVLADRFSKQKMIIALKALEIVVMAGGFLAYYYENVFGCYATMFALCFQSALLSPAKYSIIPELIRKENIPKANGAITSSSYMAIIIGTFLASFLTQVTNRNFLVSVSVCLLAAIVGFVASLYIPYTVRGKGSEKLTTFFLTQTVQTLKFCKKTPKLLLAVLGSAFFLFIGAFVQLNVIPFSMDFLNLSEIGGGYLFLGTAVGIAVGATIAGKFCKREIDLGLSCLSLAIIALALLMLTLLKTSLVGSILSLVLLGLFGGLYVVPLESYIQSFSPSEIRGQVIAAENVLGFLGVLLAPVCLFVFGKVIHASSATGFTLMALIVFATFLAIFKQLAVQFFHFFARRGIHPFYNLHFIDYPFGPNHQEDKIALYYKGASLRNIGLLFGESSKLHLFLVKSRVGFWDKWINLLASVDVLYANEKLEPSLIEKKRKGATAHIKPVYLFSSRASYDLLMEQNYFERLMNEEHYQVREFMIKHISHFRPPLKKFYKKTQVTLQFEAFAPFPENNVLFQLHENSRV